MVKHIGVLGCSYNSKNMGCVALHYSLLLLLEEIRNELKADYNYFIFDFNVTTNEELAVSNELGISNGRLHYCTMPNEVLGYSLKDSLRKVKYSLINYKAYSILKKCNLVIDLTQGDSFSDIYGKDRFYKWSVIKQKIEHMGVPLILGPQTYGPFTDEKVREFAKQIIEHATLVISRDESSGRHVMEFCKKNIIVGTDLAFRLPYDKLSIQSNKIKIGINPSGLLGKKKNDPSSLQEKISVDYDLYISDLIAWLLREKIYEVHLIPHVGNEANECFGGFEGVIYHGEFSSPIDAKGIISSMDVFIGARMHATIAAFSSGIATIPTAYSMKFASVFEGLGYPYVIDMRKMSTGQALSKTIEYIQDYSSLKDKVLLAHKLVDKRYMTMKNALSSLIQSMD